MEELRIKEKYSNKALYNTCPEIFQGQQMTKINISNGVNILKNNDTTRQQPHNFNPNRKIKAMKNAYGSSYDYTFLDLDEQQRQFYFFMQRREKRHK